MFGAFVGRGTQRRPENRARRVIYRRTYRTLDFLYQSTILGSFGHSRAKNVLSLITSQLLGNSEESSVESAVPLRAVTDASNKPTTESASDALRLSTYLFQMDYFEKTVPPDKLEELKNQVSRTFDNETSIMRSPLLELVSNGGRSIFTQNVQRVEGNPGFLPTTSSTLMSYWRESKVYLISMLIAGTFAVALPVMSSSSSWRLQSGLSSLFTPLASFFHHLFWIDSATV